jgi:hypothetical protein
VTCMSCIGHSTMQQSAACMRQCCMTTKQRVTGRGANKRPQLPPQAYAQDVRALQGAAAALMQVVNRALCAAMSPLQPANDCGRMYGCCGLAGSGGLAVPAAALAFQQPHTSSTSLKHPPPHRSSPCTAATAELYCWRPLGKARSLCCCWRCALPSLQPGGGSMATGS